MPRKFRNHEFASQSSQSERISLKFTLKKFKKALLFSSNSNSFGHQNYAVLDKSTETVVITKPRR